MTSDPKFNPRTYTLESCRAILESAAEGCTRLFLIAHGAEVIKQRHQNKITRRTRKAEMQARIDGQNQTIQQLRAAGKNQVEISAETGISKATISRRMKAMAAGAG